MRSGFPKRSRSNKGLKRDDDSTKSHRALETKALETKAFAQPLKLRSDLLAIKLLLERPERLDARLAAKLGKSRGISRADVGIG
ncbi:MAG: hypothetical protein ACK463_13270, partial [Bradyrhizobium sp.]